MGQLREVDGDILQIKRGILVHQVNCLGIMGAGLAKQIAEQFPKAEKQYMDIVSKNKKQFGSNAGPELLGNIFVSELSPEVQLVHLFGQLTVGQGVRTIYNAHRIAWPNIDMLANYLQCPVYAPKYIGCGLAGGDWNIISEIIKKACPRTILVNYKK